MSFKRVRLRSWVGLSEDSRDGVGGVRDDAVAVTVPVGVAVADKEDGSADEGDKGEMGEIDDGSGS